MIKNCKRSLYASILLLFFIVLSGNCFSQKTSKLTSLKALNKPTESKTNFGKYLKTSTNEVEATASLLFLFYKNFLSSQDMNSCVFTPSCSVYAIESLQKDNPFKAYLKIFDRLSRCHPLVANKEYPVNSKLGKYYDPAF
jgi:putative membrane protein insertion efficiency factor